ncbi:hypothetical protein C2G38_2231112 [Gigaspora rosea]|uniref:Uncharacterized protein n=1 Tax=Gigaspora rosea TaxID=44941 RepID=A0A397U2P2_9GLOM|nr:hypothetical protein C2G38_2231112 [Gigaspora rosea]
MANITSKSNSNGIYGILPYIVPEILNKYPYTKEIPVLIKNGDLSDAFFLTDPFHLDGTLPRPGEDFSDGSIH